MRSDHNRGFCGTMEPIILVAVFAIVLAVMFGFFTDRSRTSNTAELLQLIEKKAEEYQSAPEADGAEIKDKNKDAPLSRTAASLQAEDGKLIAEYSVPESVEAGTVVKLASGITASVYGDRVEVIKTSSFFVRFILLPGVILIFIIGIIVNTGTYIGDKDDKKSAIPLIVLIIFFSGLATWCLWGILHKSRITVSSDTLEYSTAGFGDFAAESSVKPAGFARRVDTKELLCLYRDDEGNVAGQFYIKEADEAELLRVVSAMNRFVPDSPLKRFLQNEEPIKEAVGDEQ